MLIGEHDALAGEHLDPEVARADEIVVEFDRVPVDKREFAKIGPVPVYVTVNLPIGVEGEIYILMVTRFLPSSEDNVPGRRPQIRQDKQACRRAKAGHHDNGAYLFLGETLDARHPFLDGIAMSISIVSEKRSDEKTGPFGEGSLPVDDRASTGQKSCAQSMTRSLSTSIQAPGSAAKGRSPFPAKEPYSSEPACMKPHF
jgi:hypothetical protein